MSKTPDKQLPKLTQITQKIKVCVDFYLGAIRVLNKNYLQQYKGENDNAYKVRADTTAFENLFAPVVDGLVGMTTKKEPVVNGFDSIDLNNIDLEDNNLLLFSKKILTQSLINGVTFCVAEKSTQHNRIFAKIYDYKNLMSYVYENNQLTQIVFKDTIEVKDEEFGLKNLERYIVFKIGGGEVWFEDENGVLKKQDEWTNSLKEIPIVAIKTGKEVSKFEIIPKLYDTAILNKVHLNLESHLANVLSVIGNPIPVFYGTVEEGKITIGVKDALRFEDKQKEGFEYVEITGSGIDKLQEKIKLIEGDIDKTTFKLLEKQTNNTVIDARETQSKNSSFLTDMAIELEVKINTLLRYILQLENKELNKDDFVEFKKDFDNDLIDIEIAKSLLLAGEMSRATFYEILRTGVLPKGFNIDDENSKIDIESGTGIND